MGILGAIGAVMEGGGKAYNDAWAKNKDAELLSQRDEAQSLRAENMANLNNKARSADTQVGIDANIALQKQREEFAGKAEERGIVRDADKTSEANKFTAEQNKLDRDQQVKLAGLARDSVGAAEKAQMDRRISGIDQQLESGSITPEQATNAKMMIYAGAAAGDASAANLVNASVKASAAADAMWPYDPVKAEAAYDATMKRVLAVSGGKGKEGAGGETEEQRLIRLIAEKKAKGLTPVAPSPSQVATPRPTPMRDLYDN